jgi:hypothetical protein
MGAEKTSPEGASRLAAPIEALEEKGSPSGRF